MSGKIEQGAKEFQTALALDKKAIKARFLIGMILLEQGSRDQDLFADLESAEAEIPEAHLALAVYYKRQGDDTEVQQQLQAFARITHRDIPHLQTWLATSGVQAEPGRVLGLW